MTALRMAFAYHCASQHAYANARFGHSSDPWYAEFTRVCAIQKALLSLEASDEH